jgi:CheY-like chemotaxis protein
MQSLRLMVVDSDDFAATLTGAALSNLGHRVVKFASAKVALQALNDGAGAYDAVFASCELDSMSGLQFAREAQRCDARLRLLAGEERSANVIVLPREHLLANPTAMQCLRRAAEHSLRVAA